MRNNSSQKIKKFDLKINPLSVKKPYSIEYGFFINN